MPIVRHCVRPADRHRAPRFRRLPDGHTLTPPVTVIDQDPIELGTVAATRCSSASTTRTSASHGRSLSGPARAKGVLRNTDRNRSMTTSSELGVFAPLVRRGQPKAHALGAIGGRVARHRPQHAPVLAGDACAGVPATLVLVVTGGPRLGENHRRMLSLARAAWT